MFVTKETPPTFWYHTFNDKTVPVEQGLRFYEALVKAGVPSEAHIFANGPHGVGLGKGDAGSGPVAQPAGELAARPGAADDGETCRQTVGNGCENRLLTGKKNGLKNEEAGSRLREWKDFPKPAARWTLDWV